MISASDLCIEPVQPSDAAGFSEPEEHVARLLLRFANGLCTPEERVDVCRMLRLHPAWLRWLADQVRYERPIDRPSARAAN